MTEEEEFDEATAKVAKLTAKILKDRGLNCIEDAATLSARLESSPLAATARNAATANKMLLQQATAYLSAQDRTDIEERNAIAAKALEQEQPLEEYRQTR